MLKINKGSCRTVNFNTIGKLRNNNNNNNNNNNKLQLGCHPVAVVIIHVHKYEKKVTRKFKSEGLHEKHLVATWKLGNHCSIRL